MADKLSLRQLLRLFRLYARMDLDWLTQDTKACVITVLCDILSCVSSISAVMLLAVRFGGVGNLSQNEVLFMLGYSSLVSGVFTMCFCGYNVAYISRRIGRSQLDHMMIQPLPLYAQLLTEGFLPFTGTGPMICGIAVTAYSVCNIGYQLPPWFLPALLFMVACSALIILGASYLIAVTAFYKPVSCEEISTIMIDALSSLGKYPLGGLTAAAKIVLITILPAGLMGWFPALLLLGKAPMLPGIFLPAFIAASTCSLAALGFRKGMQHYVKVGSNRYRAIGHRN